MATGAKAALWCPACLEVTVAKVLTFTPGFTRITRAQCDDCGFEFEPGAAQVPDQGKQEDHDPDHTRDGNVIE